MKSTTLPVLFLENIILFPGSDIRIELDADKEKGIISLAMSYYNNHILIVNDSHYSIAPSIENYIGVIGFINMKIDLPNNKIRIVIHGMERLKITSSLVEDTTTVATGEACSYKSLDKEEEIAYCRSLINKLETYINNNPNISNSIISEISNITDLNKLTDIIAAYIITNYERKIDYLKEINPLKRVTMLFLDIAKDLKVLELEDTINEKVSKSIEDEQKNYILQEKLKVIKEELNETYDLDDEINKLKDRVSKLPCKKSIKERLNKEIRRLSMTPASSPEGAIIMNYIDEMLSLPWGFKTYDNKDLKKAEEILNKSHYGLEDVKERVLEYLALLQVTNKSNSPVICLVGPPGVGKTSFAKAISEAMNRKFVKISVGGISDEAEIVGHRRAYLGSSCGRIIKGIKKAGSMNPVFVIDEIDKMTKDIKGDPASSLLEVLDKEQNKKFYDNYIEEEFDLSNVMFITTANYKDQIPFELLDRMEIIELTSYTEYEKCEICTKHIIPKTIKLYNLENKGITFTKNSILKIIRDYTKESGVRELERCVALILRKVIKDMLTGLTATYKIDDYAVKRYLGLEKYNYNKNDFTYQVGVVNGMSYTIFGGDILKIEANYYKGNGNIITTGLLGDVFKESTSIALSYIKSNYKKFGIIYDLLKESDIHIHVPSGAVKKDGPSAGVAITTALISLFCDKKIPSNISMTGEITLHGDVLPIGGLKEKIIGAKRAGIKKIYLPIENKQDLEAIDDYIKDKITFKLVKNYMEIYEDLL